MSAALDDLARAVVTLRGGSEALSAAAHTSRRLDLGSPAILLAGPEPAAALLRAQWRRAAVVRILRELAEDVEDLSRRTARVHLGYRVAEREAALTIGLARATTVLATRSLLAAGSRVGLFDDGVAAAAEPVPVDADSRTEIWDLASIMTSQSLLSGRPVVRVIEIPRPDGSSAWILQIPGTQAWHPRAGAVAHDLTSDLRLMAHPDAALARGALDALSQAQRASDRLGRGDPVMISGHSLGGIAAVAIAADPRSLERFRITHVVTAGAPVGHLEPDETVVVLSLEHADDLVPRADLTANPDREHWTTVRRDVPGGRMLSSGTAPSEHGAVTYRETARLAVRAGQDGTEASLSAWTASASPFLRDNASTGEHLGSQRVRDYRVGRVTQSRS